MVYLKLREYIHHTLFNSARVIRRSNCARVDSKFDASKLADDCLKQSRARKASANRLHSVPEELSSVCGLTRTGVELKRHGQYSQALKYFEDAISIQTKQGSEDDANLANAYSNIASLLLILGGVDQGLDSLEKCMLLGHRFVVLKSDFVCMAGSLMHIAQNYAVHEKYEESIQHFGRILRIYRISYGKASAAVAGTLEKLGAVYFRIGEYDLSLKAFIGVRNIIHKNIDAIILSEEMKNKKIAAITYNIGVIFKRKRFFMKARRCFVCALNVYLRFGNEVNEIERENRIRLLRFHISKIDHELDQSNNVHDI